MTRQPNPERQVVEVRPMVPSSVVAVLDAVCINRGGISRTDLVNDILEQWARSEARKATVIVNVLRGNPGLLDDAA